MFVLVAAGAVVGVMLKHCQRCESSFVVRCRRPWRRHGPLVSVSSQARQLRVGKAVLLHP